jgi:AraC family transcriptional regulator
MDWYGSGGRKGEGMGLAAKAVWLVETHLTKPVSLADIAAACDVSRFHLARAFGMATGRTVMRYARARRLSEAARALSRGAPDILAVALDTGYASHEAFTRAFRDQFGVTPEEVRRGGVDQLELVEPIEMTDASSVHLEEPRRETGEAMLIAGPRGHYTVETNRGIPAQWQRFHDLADAIPGRAGDMAYGVCCDFREDGRFDYVCGVAVTRADDMPAGVSTVRIPSANYLVFRHTGHVSGISATWRAIMDDWLPASGVRMGSGHCFERYGSDFDGERGEGVVEIWIPVEA